MKKTIFLMLLVATAWSVKAQEVLVTRKSNPVLLGTTVPSFIKADFQVNNPGITVISWDPVQGYWRASYKVDNKINYDYYDANGVDYRASLPVTQNNVPEAVIATAINAYGPVVYGITKIKAANNTEVYQLRLMENDVTRTVWMDVDGKEVLDVYKVKTDDVVAKIQE
ncbi:MAG: hypothetical protein ABIT05_15015 [Chitinophagaceae bacterium]